MSKTAAVAASIICPAVAALAALAAVLCSSARPAASPHSLATPNRALSAWLPTWDGGAAYRQVLAHASEFRLVSPYWYATTGDPASR